ncbi:putative F-box protein At2g36090 [Bidens hawaiensis]|uniref:putative F-box protein At2g36090 n=1 Tax=Bidens hawaiensis TaxID=980011 RepID=UPI00404A55BC
MSKSTTTGITSLPAEIIESHVLTRLDGQTLAAVSCASAAVHSMSETNHRLWSDVCHSTWPSTSGEIVTGIISGFSSNGHREVYSQAFPLPSPDPTIIIPPSSPPRSEKLINLTTTRLISAVDIYHRNKLIFTKTEETETISGWFQCSPFRIDLLDPKDMVPTEIPHPDQDCTSLTDDMTLSWILIDPNSKRAVNLSSHRPVSVQRHWLTGDVQMRFASVLAGDNHPQLMQCAVVVSCGRSEGGEMQVRELSMQVEDMDGKHLNGKDSLVILQRVMNGKRGNGVKREKEARNRYKKFEEMKREKRERKLRVEETLDMLSVVFGLSVFAAMFFIFC